MTPLFTSSFYYQTCHVYRPNNW